MMLYGFALLEKGRCGAIKLISAGAAIGLVFRPYLLFVFVPSFLLAVCIMKSHARSPQRFLLTVGVMGLACALFPATLHYIGIGHLDTSDLLNRVDVTYVHNAVGGSALNQNAPASVAQFIRQLPSGCVNLFFRPFPWEAHNVNAYFASIENVALALCVVYVFFQRRLAVKGLFKRPLPVFAVTCAALLIVLYSPNPNLGLLSRMRTPIIPLIAMALCCGIVSGAHLRSTWPSGHLVAARYRFYRTSRVPLHSIVAVRRRMADKQ